jgi:tetratricopeptide (TPR) repeat protein
VSNSLIGRPVLALIAACLVVVGAPGDSLAECSPGQMAEAQLQFAAAQPLLDTQQWPQAIAQLRSIVEFCPEFFPALRGLGVAYQQSDQLDLAAQAYARVIEVRGDEAEAPDFANLAQVLTRQKRFREARAEYLKARARDAHNCGVLVNLGILHNASGYPLQAVETLEDALMFCPDLAERILPRLAEAATKAAEQQRKIGNTERANIFAQKATEYSGSAGGTTAYQQIQAAMKRKDYPAAIALCDQLVAREPEHANAWLTKARAADAMSDKPLAIAAYRKYLELRPENIDETAAMIIVMAEAEQCDASVAAARDAVRKFAGVGSLALGKIHFAYGKALFCAGDYAAARTQFQRAVQSGDDVWVRAAREGINASNEQLDYEAAQRQRAAQQGG